MQDLACQGLRELNSLALRRKNAQFPKLQNTRQSNTWLRDTLIILLLLYTTIVLLIKFNNLG